MKNVYFRIIKAGVLFFFVCGTKLLSVNYYVSNSTGSSVNSGLSSTSPLKTLQDVNNLSLNPGDTVFFKRGDTWNASNGGYGSASQLNFKSGNAAMRVVYTSYGKGNMPIISGAKEISTNGWQLYKGSVYKKNIGGVKESSLLYFNEKLLIPARWPNYSFPSNGLAIADYVNSLTMQMQYNYLVDSSLKAIFPNAADLSGAVITANDRFSLETRAVTSYDPLSNRIYFNSAASYFTVVAFDNNRGYYISNALALLDTAGEWFFDQATQDLYIYFPNGAAPKSTDKISWASAAIGAGPATGTQSYFSVIGLDFRHHSSVSVNIPYTINATIKNCNFLNTKTGIQCSWQYTRPTENALIENNSFAEINYEAIAACRSKNCTIQGNTINRVGVIMGLGQAVGDEFWLTAEGINFQTGAENNIVKYNNIDSCGRMGITIARTKESKVSHNVINAACLNFNDCGGIYSAGNADSSSTPPGYTLINNVIEYNIVKNVYGNYHGTYQQAYKKFDANSIYPDVARYGADTIRYNTVINGTKGICLYDNINEYVYGNTFYNAGQSQVNITRVKRSGTAVWGNNTIKNNIMFSLHPDAPALEWTDWEDNGKHPDDNNFFEGNRYWNVFQQRPIVTNNDLGVPIFKDAYNVGKYNLADWKAGGYGNNEKQGWERLYKYDFYNLLNTIGNNLVSNSGFSGGTTGWTQYQVTIAAVAHDSLTGNSLQFSQTTGTKAYVRTVLSLPMIAGKKYMIRFSIIADSNINVTVRVGRTDWHEEFNRSYTITTNRQDIYAVFTPEETYTSPRLEFWFRGGATVNIDDVSFYEVSVIFSDPTADYPIFVNETAVPKSFSLGGYAHFDLDSNIITAAQITLAPYTSKILIKTNISTTGINENKTENLLTTYPNPSNGVFNVIADGLQGKNFTLSVYNSIGEVVFQKIADDIFQTIDLQEQPPGIYFVTVETENVKASRRIILLRS